MFLSISNISHISKRKIFFAFESKVNAKKSFPIITIVNVYKSFGF